MQNPAVLGEDVCICATVGIFNQNTHTLKQIRIHCVKNHPGHTFHSFAIPVPLTSCPLLC